MTTGARRRVRCWRSYGFEHPDCGMPPPAALQAAAPAAAGSGGGSADLTFDLSLVAWLPAARLSRFSGVDDGDCFKLPLAEGDGAWEQPAPMCEVALEASARRLAPDGAPLAGDRWWHAPASAPLTATMGAGALPPGLEACVARLTPGERAAFILPSPSLAPAAGGAAGALPAPPAGDGQTELELRLLRLTAVRDVAGDGGVVKRRLGAGAGAFPMDCPLQDTRVTVHYRLLVAPPGASAAEAAAAAAAASTSGGSGNGAPWAYDSRVEHPDGVSFETGCEQLPAGLELAVKLMLPGELSAVGCAPRYGYAGRDDAPPGAAAAAGDAAVAFELLLVDFERQGHWSAMGLDERLAAGERRKAAANALVAARRFGPARARYAALLQALEGTRDVETEEQGAALRALVVATALNAALCAHELGEHAEAVRFCDTALQYEPASAKALFRRGKAQSARGEHAEARADFAAAAAADPSTAGAVAAALAADRRLAAAAEAKQRREFGNLFQRKARPEFL